MHMHAHAVCMQYACSVHAQRTIIVLSFEASATCTCMQYACCMHAVCMHSARAHMHSARVHMHSARAHALARTRMHIPTCTAHARMQTRSVVYEMRNGMYRPLSYAISTTLVQIPALIIISFAINILSFAIGHWPGPNLTRIPTAALARTSRLPSMLKCLIATT